MGKDTFCPCVLSYSIDGISNLFIIDIMEEGSQFVMVSRFVFYCYVPNDMIKLMSIVFYDYNVHLIYVCNVTFIVCELIGTKFVKFSFIVIIWNLLISWWRVTILCNAVVGSHVVSLVQITLGNVCHSGRLNQNKGAGENTSVGEIKN